MQSVVRSPLTGRSTCIFLGWHGQEFPRKRLRPVPDDLLVEHGTKPPIYTFRVTPPSLPGQASSLFKLEPCSGDDVDKAARGESAGDSRDTPTSIGGVVCSMGKSVSLLSSGAALGGTLLQIVNGHVH